MRETVKITHKHERGVEGKERVVLENVAFYVEILFRGDQRVDITETHLLRLQERAREQGSNGREEEGRVLRF